MEYLTRAQYESLYYAYIQGLHDGRNCENHFEDIIERWFDKNEQKNEEKPQKAQL